MAGQRIVTVPIGGLWDSSDWEIRYDESVCIDFGTSPCPHCHTPHKDKHSHNCVICPRVAVATNEGGHNSTGICIDCILEAIKEPK